MKALLLTLLSVTLSMATVTNYKVLNSEGQELKNFSLEIIKSEKEIVSMMIDEIAEVVKVEKTNLDGSTKSFTWTAKDTNVTGEVKESILYYKGRFKGKEVDISISLDEGVPFMLNTRDSLVPFIYSNKQSIYLYVTSSMALGAYKFKATKEKEVQLKIDDKVYHAIQVDFALTGVASIFSDSDKLFFSSKDGRFLKRIDSRNNRVELIDNDWD